MLKRLLHSMRREHRARLSADTVTALNDAGISAWHRGDLAAAERELRAAIAANPAFAPAYGNLGMVIWEQRRLDEGLATLRQAVALDPDHIGARINLANALAIGNVHQEAIGHYREVLRRRHGHPLATANLLKPLLDVCDWDGADAIVSELVERWRTASGGEILDSMTPFVSLLVDIPQAMRLDVARRYGKRVVEQVADLPRPARATGRGAGRLRIGYASADFHDHATAHLAAGLFERHDRERFEVYAYSFGIDDGSDYRKRLVAAFEHFRDVRTLAHDEIAQRIAADGVDILVDLKGYTGEGRPQVLALRPAPVQVNYLGYPGAMAAPFVDFILADGILIPPGEERWYGEEVVRLPESYQPNDDRQPIAEHVPARGELGLPDSAFVFVSFNEQCKIERAIFDCWMRILGAVPSSVLWLLGGHGETALRRAAAARGVDPSRIVFAPKRPKPAHLARHRAADLFLDTHTCNAHTTASDALWAGLPLLAWPGEGFAGRVSSSLLRAIGLPELVAPDLESYERTAVALAREPERLGALRARLADNRLRGPLFDTERFTRNLEAAYVAVWERHRAAQADSARSQSAMAC